MHDYGAQHEAAEAVLRYLRGVEDQNQPVFSVGNRVYSPAAGVREVEAGTSDGYVMVRMMDAHLRLQAQERERRSGRDDADLV